MSNSEPTDARETIEELRSSFSYGSRSNLNFKFLRGLSDADFGDFLEELFDAVGHAIDTGGDSKAVDVAYRWQVRAYGADARHPEEFRYYYADVPQTPLTKPLSEARLVLVTSSGHFVDGDDPMPFGEPAMSQQEAERRIMDFIAEAPTLSRIPVDTPPERLRVRHGGYPVQGVQADSEVALPMRHLRDLVDDGVIGELVEDAFSFVGAAAQGRLRSEVAPEWAGMVRDLGADAALLIPV